MAEVRTFCPTHDDPCLSERSNSFVVAQIELFAASVFDCASADISLTRRAYSQRRTATDALRTPGSVDVAALASDSERSPSRASDSTLTLTLELWLKIPRKAPNRGCGFQLARGLTSKVVCPLSCPLHLGLFFYPPRCGPVQAWQRILVRRDLTGAGGARPPPRVACSGQDQRASDLRLSSFPSRTRVQLHAPKRLLLTASWFEEPTVHGCPDVRSGARWDLETAAPGRAPVLKCSGSK